MKSVKAALEETGQGDGVVCVETMCHPGFEFKRNGQTKICT